MRKRLSRVLKNRIFIFILGGLILGSAGVLAATYFPSSDVTYDNSSSGLSSTDVQGAIDELYNECFPPEPPTAGNQILDKVEVVNNGDGLYKDEYEDGRYLYKGKNPNNYIKLSNAMYRIVSIESDGTIKVVKEDSVVKMAYDLVNNNRYNASGYCNSSEHGCNIWGSNRTMLNSAGENINYMVRSHGDEQAYPLPNNEASLNTYLNTTFYYSIPEPTKSKIAKHYFNVGITVSGSEDIKETLDGEKEYKWEGYVAVINISDYIRASSDKNCTSGYNYVDVIGGSCNQNNYLSKNDIRFWTLGINSLGDYGDQNKYTMRVNTVYNGYISECALGNCTWAEYDEVYAYPVFYLKKDITLNGAGTKSDPYVIE